MAKGDTQRPVRISEKLRKAHLWFEEGLAKLKARMVDRKRQELTVSGPKLKPEEVKALTDELEEIQRKLIPLELRHEELSEKLLAHWAHTGITEVEGNLGKTLFHPSFTVTIDPKILEKEDVSDSWLVAMSERRLVPEKMLSHAEKIGLELSSIILKAARASVKVNITPPSSRRPKSGELLEEE